MAMVISMTMQGASLHRRHGVRREAFASASGPGQDKVLHLLRHGTTHMNVYLETNHIGSQGFRDPLLYDTRLAPIARAHAHEVAARIPQLHPAPQLLVLSPLTRALETAAIVFPQHIGSPDPPCPVLVEPLWRERLILSSDVGRAPAVLASEYLNLNFDHLPNVWWYTGGTGDPMAIIQEPDDVFDGRMRQLHDWLLSRPESCIAVISHQAPLGHLTGDHWRNTELRTLRLSELRCST